MRCAATEARRGASLVEVVVALALATIAFGAVGAALLALERRGWALIERARLRGEAVGLTLLLERELGTLWRDTLSPPALLATGPGRLAWRAPRGLGLVCAVDGSTLAVRPVGRWPRLPAAGRDELLVLAPEAADTSSRWSLVPIAAVSGGGCGGAAARLATPLPPDSAAPLLGAVVRVMERRELTAYASDGAWWLGTRALGVVETVQPLAGPIVPGSFGSELVTPGAGAESLVVALRLTRRTAEESLRVSRPVSVP